MRCRSILSLCLCLSLSGGFLSIGARAQPSAADGLPSISSSALEAHLEFLASDLLEGRDTGSKGYQLAAAYVAAQFKELGLEPAGDDGTYFQAVPLRKNEIDHENTTVEIARGENRFPLDWGEDFLMQGDPVLDATDLTAPIAFVGFGVHAPEVGYDDYEGIDVEGKIVLMMRRAPASFHHNERAYYSSPTVKARAAVERGAVGMLIFMDEEATARFPWERVKMFAGRPGMRWLDENGIVNDHFPELRGGAFMSHPGLEKMLAGTGTSLTDLFEAVADGTPGSRELPLEMTISQRSTHEDLYCQNVAAILPGSDPQLAAETVLYTAHLDHIGIGAEVEGDGIYNGAYDNAMGTSVLLETARAFTEQAERPKRSIAFVAVTGEEKGLLGSDYFARHPTVPAEGIVANVNLDMPLFLYSAADFVAFGAEHSTLEAVVERAAASVGMKLSPDPMPEEVIFIRSDQYSLVRQGVPAVFLVTGFEARDEGVNGMAVLGGFQQQHYHMPSDDLSQPVDYPSAVRFTQANYRIGLEVANTEKRPEWNPGDFFGDKFGR